MMTSLRRPRHGTLKQRCFDEYFSVSAKAAVRIGVEQTCQGGHRSPMAGRRPSSERERSRRTRAS